MKSFETTLMEVLNKHTPLRKKFLVANHAPYMTKSMRKAKIQTDLRFLKKQKTYCIKLYKNEGRKYYESLDIKNFEFWKKMKHFLSDENAIFSQISIE